MQSPWARRKTKGDRIIAVSFRGEPHVRPQRVIIASKSRFGTNSNQGEH